MFVLHFEGCFEEGDSSPKEVHGRELCDNLAGMGSPFALAGVGVDLTPGAASESKLLALRAGRENLSAETDLGHSGQML